MSLLHRCANFQEQITTQTEYFTDYFTQIKISKDKDSSSSSHK